MLQYNINILNWLLDYKLDEIINFIKANDPTQYVKIKVAYDNSILFETGYTSRLQQNEYMITPLSWNNYNVKYHVISNLRNQIKFLKSELELQNELEEEILEDENLTW